MTNPEDLSLLAQKPASVKNAVIKKLSTQWPLTTKQLHHALTREQGINTSYQAVHKALTQLEEEKVVEKEPNGYQLNTDWIQKIAKLSNQINTNYETGFALDPKKEITQFAVSNWLNMARFIAFTFSLQYPNPENKPSICNWTHVWPIVGLSSEEVKILQESFQKEKHYSLCPSDTAVDKGLADWLNKIGKKCQTGTPISLDHDYMVKGDHICQVYYTQEFSKKINEIYKSVKNFEKIDYAKLTELINEKTKIQIIIIKNKELADEIREITVSYFN